MNAKIKDVAQRAGVSISTVSNALSGRKNVSPDKYAAVMAAVRTPGVISMPPEHAEQKVTLSFTLSAR